MLAYVRSADVVLEVVERSDGKFECDAYRKGGPGFRFKKPCDTPRRAIAHASAKVLLMHADGVLDQ